MSLPFAIDQRLTPKDHTAFIRLAHDLRTTGDRACKWLEERGYRISHGAVCNYIRSARREARTPFAPKLASRNSGELRRQIAEWCKQLPAGELAVVAGVAAYLRNTQMLRRQASFKGVRAAD